MSDDSLTAAYLSGVADGKNSELTKIRNLEQRLAEAEYTWRNMEQRLCDALVENDRRNLRIAELEQRLYVARDLLQQIHDCPVNWVESTIPKGGMDPDNPKHRGQVVGTQHISYTRLYRIAAFLHQNIELEKGE